MITDTKIIQFAEEFLGEIDDVEPYIEGIDEEEASEWFANEYPDIDITGDLLERFSLEVSDVADNWNESRKSEERDNFRQSIENVLEEVQYLDNTEIASLLINIATNYLPYV